jgi:hypothetical protein
MVKTRTNAKVRTGRFGLSDLRQNGHITAGTHKEDLSPKEMQKRAEAAMKQ